MRSEPTGKRSRAPAVVATGRQAFACSHLYKDFRLYIPDLPDRPGGLDKGMEYPAEYIVIQYKENLMSLSVFFYLALAAWRIASLVANEDGPWQMFKRLRQRAEQWCQDHPFCRELGVHELFACEWCNSIWIGIGLTLMYLWLGPVFLYIALPLALSTVVIVIKYVVQLLQSAHQYLENANRAHEELRSDLLFHAPPSIDSLATPFREKR
jgi:hypothetical protein